MLDLTKPIEAVHPDGRKVDVKLVGKHAAHFNISPHLPMEPEANVEHFSFKYETGKSVMGADRVGWRIQNKQPQTLPEDVMTFLKQNSGAYGASLLIKKYEQVDPALKRAREIYAEFTINPTVKSTIMRGGFDAGSAMQAVVAAVKENFDG